MQLVHDGGLLIARQKLDDQGRTHPTGKRGTQRYMQDAAN